MSVPTLTTTVLECTRSDTAMWDVVVTDYAGAAALIELAVQDPGQKAIALLLWRNASAFKRNNPFILLVATILGKTGEETDTLFRTAVNF